MLGRGTTGKEPGECKGTNMGSPRLTDKETEARERQGLSVAPEPAVGRVLGSSGLLHEVYFLLFFLIVKMCLFTILEKLPFLQKFLYEQDSKKNYNSSLCQTKNIHPMYTNCKKHTTGNVNIGSLYNISNGVATT